ncbi:MAG: 3-deoxy-manno-octulosonate cytidylyltransferase [Bacteroidota bacterium]
MKVLGVIPARYASSRFPGKPLVDIAGKSMIQRVYEQAQQAELLDAVVVATDDARIFSHVEGFGGQVHMTADTHVSGTERAAEIAEKMPDYTHYLNIQGDEPFIAPSQIDLLCSTLAAGADIGTLIKPLTNPERLTNPNAIKVVLDQEGFGLYFSRSPIPFLRDEPDVSKWPERGLHFQHIGIYGFRREVLMNIPHLSPSPLEVSESLEQLRWLAQGYRIKTALTHEAATSVDTPEDLERLLEGLEEKA